MKLGTSSVKPVMPTNYTKKPENNTEKPFGEWLIGQPCLSIIGWILELSYVCLWIKTFRFKTRFVIREK